MLNSRQALDMSRFAYRIQNPGLLSSDSFNTVSNFVGFSFSSVSFGSMKTLYTA